MMQLDNSGKRPAIYVRVSTEEQAQSGTSLESQIRSLENHLKAEQAPEPLVFIDDGYSGSTPNRPGLMQLEAAIAEGRVSKVTVTALDRLARDLVLQETLLTRWAKQDVGFISEREPDLGKADATRILVRQVLGAISQYERAVITGRMAAGRIARAHQGFWPGGKVPYGYVLEGVPPRVVMDHDQAAILQEAGNRALAGETAATIAADFNRRAITGPSGNGWKGSYLSRMLRNPAYKGEARYGVREGVEPSQRRKAKHAVARTKNAVRIRPEEEWLTIEIPAVFSDNQWEVIQKTLTARGKPGKKSGTYLLSRRFRSSCGSIYHGNYNNGKPRYLCNNRSTRKMKGGVDCGCPAVTGSVVDEAVWRAIAMLLENPGGLVTTAREELAVRGLAKAESELRRGVESLDRKLSKARRTVGRIVRFHAEKDTLDDTSFEAAVGSLQGDVARLEQERERLLSALPGGRLEADEKVLGQIGAEFLDKLEKLTFTVKRQVFAMLDVHVQMEPTGQIVASLAIPRPVEADQRKVLKRTFFRSDLHTSH